MRIPFRPPSAGRLASALCAVAIASACSAPKHEPEAPHAATPAATEKPAAPVAHLEAPAADPDEDDPKPLDGHGLYVRNCAGCHNENGDGQGPTILALGQKARSFAQGGFAFGNTHEAIYRTITAGMPGTSLMPSFRGTLSDDERHLVVDYVLTLTPKVDDSSSPARIMKVGTEAVFARGKLPPISEGKPERPRGLLVGLPSGLTFEYRTDDVRMLGVRQGDFADRTDWNDRGGGELKPLGKLIYACEGGDPSPAYEAWHDGKREVLRGQLKATWLSVHEPRVNAFLYLPDGQFWKQVSEGPRDQDLSIGGAFTRTWHVLAGPETRKWVIIAVAGSTPKADWMWGYPTTWGDDQGLPTGELPADGWIVSRREGAGIECVRVTAPPGTRLVRDDGVVRVLVEAPVGFELEEVELSATIVIVPEWSEALHAKLSQELAR